MTSNAEFYDAFASKYEDYYADIDAQETVRQWLHYLECQELVDPYNSRLSSPPVLLDLGCGPGWHLRPWQRASFSVCGLDSSPNMLRLAAKNAKAGNLTNIPLYCASITRPKNLTVLSKKFDIIVGHFNLLNLFSPEQISSLFDAIVLILKEGGIFVTDTMSQYQFFQQNKNNQHQDFCGWVREVQSWTASSVSVVWKRSNMTYIETFWNHHKDWLSQQSESKNMPLIHSCGWHPYTPNSAWRDSASAMQYLHVFRKTRERSRNIS